MADGGSSMNWQSDPTTMLCLRCYTAVQYSGSDVPNVGTFDTRELRAALSLAAGSLKQLADRVEGIEAALLVLEARQR